MAITTTYSLIKPTVGGSTDTWGADINDNLDTIDALLDGTTAISPKLSDTTGSEFKVGSTAVTATGAELNYLDIAILGTSEDSKAVTQDASGTIVVGATDGDQTLDIASHDLVDGGLSLGGTLVTASAAELNTLDGVNSTLTATELNTLDGVNSTLTATELNHVEGVTSSIQTQLGTKAATVGSSSQTFSVATPTSNAHATTKSYVDGQTTTFSGGDGIDITSGTVKVDTCVGWTGATTVVCGYQSTATKTGLDKGWYVFKAEGGQGMYLNGGQGSYNFGRYAESGMFYVTSTGTLTLTATGASGFSITYNKFFV